MPRLRLSRPGREPPDPRHTGSPPTPQAQAYAVPRRHGRDWLTITVSALPGLAALAALGVSFAAVQTARAQVQASEKQASIAAEQEVSDRYNAAVKELGNHSLEVRLGGLYVLQRIMQDSPREQLTVVPVMCAFIRHHSPPHRSSQASLAPRPDDVQAALAIVASRTIIFDRSTVIDLDNIELANAEFAGGNFTRAYLPGADLSRADLTRANLTEANLTLANLTSASVAEAKLIDGNLTRANLTGASLARADLSGADLAEADLNGADLAEADLSGANVAEANFARANLTGALWPTYAAIPGGWQRDAHSGRLKRTDTGSRSGGN